MELARAGSVIVRRMYLLVLGALCIGAFTYFWSARQPVTYTASAQVVVALQPGETITSQHISHAAALARSYAKQPLPNAVVQTVYDTVRARTPAQIRDELVLSAAAGQPQIALVVRDANPVISRDVVNAAAVAFAEYYSRQSLDEDASLAKREADTRSLLQQIGKDISQTQEALATAQAQHADTAALQAQLDSQQAQQSQLNQQLATITQARGELPVNLWVAKIATEASREGQTPVVNAAFGMAAGIFAGICLALLLDLLDGVVRVSNDTARFAGLQTIGTVRRSSAEEDEPSTMTADEYFAVAEAYSGLLRNLRFLNATQSLQVLLVAPAGGGSSMDLVGIRVAISYALAGTRTLVIDANWAVPTLEARFGLPLAERGFFTSLVAVRQNLGTPLGAIAATTIPGLYALPVGLTPPNLDDLLSSSLLDQLIALLTANFEQIVVLAPAELDTIAGQQLAGRMHGALVVAYAGSTTGRELAEIAQSLRRAHCYVPGAVLVSENGGRAPTRTSARLDTADSVSTPSRSLQSRPPTVAMDSMVGSSTPAERSSAMTLDA